LRNAVRLGRRFASIHLLRLVGERLAAFKTPRKIVLLLEIPKGATGKVQRIGLGQRPGLA
jgi:oxalate---CoA ligase